MQPVVQLIRIEHGSRLYGTSTPTSDTDFKGVHLPSGDAILLQRAENHISRNIVSKIDGTDKNASDAIDDESFSVQRFFEMLMKGDTVATEILFAPVPRDTDVRWAQVAATGRRLLNRQCKGFVGYCVRQAAKYGIKGSRMAAVKSLLDNLKRWEQSYGADKRLGECFRAIDKLVIDHEHMSFENIPHPDGRPCIHLVCCDRKMPETVFIGEAIKVYQKVWENYGERARAAMTNQGIDWKAMSHAVRVAGQAIELLETGKITFPRPNAEFLREIKLGKLTYDTVSARLEALVAKVHEASERSRLPEKSDHILADEMVRHLYREQLK